MDPFPGASLLVADLAGRGGGAAASSRWRVGEKEAGEEVVGEGGGAAAGVKEENEDF